MTILNASNRAPEHSLILGCSRTDVPPEQETYLPYLLKQDLDWDYIVAVSERNGVLPLMSSTLLGRFREYLSPPVENRLSESFHKHARASMFMTAKLVELTKLFDAHHIAVLPLKGPSLAVQAYGDVSLRQFVDLDVLVKPRHFDTAVAILSQNGYLPASKPNWFRRKALFFTHKKDIVLINERTGICVELHWKLSGTHFSMPFEMTQLWDRLEKLRLGGTTVVTMSFKDQFVYLCLHGSRHEWERLAWVCDLNELVKAADRAGIRIDWDEVHRHARQHGCERVVELGLFLLEAFFDVRTEFAESKRIAANTAFKEIGEQVMTKIFAPARTPSLKKEKYLYLLSLQERRAHRIKLYLVYLIYYLRLLLTPNSLDMAIFHLPRLFYPLYFILRPIRLLLAFLGMRYVEREVK